MPRLEKMDGHYRKFPGLKEEGCQVQLLCRLLEINKRQDVSSDLFRSCLQQVPWGHVLKDILEKFHAQSIAEYSEELPLCPFRLQGCVLMLV